MSEIVNKLTFKETVHRNRKVILCFFEYDPAFLTRFRKEFPAAKWSRTSRAWYLPDSIPFRKKLNLPLPEIGDNWIPKLYEHNKGEFIKFRNALTQKAFSPNTIRTYLGEFAQLLIILKNHPVDQLNTQKLNAYLLYCIKKLKHSESQVYSRMNAIKSYYTLVLHDEKIFDRVIRPKSTKKLPIVLSRQEIKKIFSATSNLKHLLILKMAYGMRLRVSELANLRVRHIDLDRMQILISSPKGKKDRMVNFPKSLVPLYSDYLKAYQPADYLFEGQNGGQYAIRSIQAVFQNAMKKAGIKKSIGIHGMRHSYATHLLEAGTDIVFIQKLLRHKQVKTTEIYARVSTKVLSKVQSPLDNLN